MRVTAISIVASALLVAACGGDAPPASGTDSGAEVPAAETRPLPAGDVTELTVIDVEIGGGAVAEPGATARVHYTGWLYDPEAEDRRGRQFDTSRQSPQGFVFPVGAGRVIRGWDEGVAGMRVGGRRLLFIPPDYGYGARGAGGVIPPNATLVFDVELLEVPE